MSSVLNKKSDRIPKAICPDCSGLRYTKINGREICKRCGGVGLVNKITGEMLDEFDSMIALRGIADRLSYRLMIAEQQRDTAQNQLNNLYAMPEVTRLLEGVAIKKFGFAD